ncbi:hypothetical protein [Janibacter cremeus]|uniref:DUF2269 family protein n=1 Tax=Janibacter cremeus TaxID=1285192 RepID=A0A852VQ60_9MICO|nr:hypothetical protein [Janibacter cremeus]NYF99177.1 hypothetical protein [Janibacter cremeus]
MTAIAWILVALGVLALVLTQVRLRRYRGQRGMTDIAPWVINLHSAAGGAGLLLVALRLLDIVSSTTAMWLAIVGLAIASLIGLTFLARWRRASGRHAESLSGDGWTSGPWLSRIAHFGMVIGTVFLAWGMLSDTF